MRERIAQLPLHRISPEAMALAVTVGLVFGVCPMYGCPTLLCVLASVTLRVNAPVVQIVNQLVTPLQWALLLPFIRVGKHLLGAPHAPAAQALGWRIWDSAAGALTAWFLLGIPAGLFFYLCLIALLRRGGAARPL